MLLVPAVHVVILDRWLWPKKSSLPRQFRGSGRTQQLLLASTESPIGNLRTHYKDIIAIFSYEFAIGIAATSCWQLPRLDVFLHVDFWYVPMALQRGPPETAVGEAKVEDRPRSSQQAAIKGRCKNHSVSFFFFSRIFCLISSLLLSKDVVFVMERWQASVTYLETLKIYQISGVV